jgi:acyl-CoA hydrolase
METYAMVLTEHLNHHGTLFGGQLLKWVDEYAWMAASLDFTGKRLVTRAMDNIEFKNSAPNGAILRFVIEKERVGHTSATYSVIVYCNAPGAEKEYVLFSNHVTLVAIGADGQKTPIV